MASTSNRRATATSTSGTPGFCILDVPKTWILNEPITIVWRAGAADEFLDSTVHENAALGWRLSPECCESQSASEIPRGFQGILRRTETLPGSLETQ